MTGDADPQGLELVLEHVPPELVREIRPDRPDSDRDNEGDGDGLAAVTRTFETVRDVLRPQDLGRTRVVLTGDLVQSVHDRGPWPGEPYSREVGAGIVVGKTMAPTADGFVDILIPVHDLLPSGPDDDRGLRDRYSRHVAAHEAVHASMFHLGTDPFDAHLRGGFGPATGLYLAMAGEQVEEHLAEYLANQVARRASCVTAELMTDAFGVWLTTMRVDIPALDEDDPEYYQKGWQISFSALQILWKRLAYVAAELRDGDDVRPVPAQVSGLEEWSRHVAPWWPEYVRLLARIPMTIDVDVPATDQVVEQIGAHLQRWALGLGLDFHDLDDGAWFSSSFE
jgi:hypothetical protein